MYLSYQICVFVFKYMFNILKHCYNDDYTLLSWTTHTSLKLYHSFLPVSV